MKQAAFSLMNRIEEVDPMVLSLKAAVTGHLPDEKLFAFDLCASEALTNVVKHGSPDDVAVVIDLCLSVGDEAVTLEIFDAPGAPPFDLRDHATDLSDVSLMAESGRGLGLIMQCADRVDYAAVAGRNRLSLTFLKGAE